MLRILLTTFVVALFSAAILAQEGGGAITGVVRDSQRGVIPGAIVRVVNEATAVAAAEVVTDEEGSYRAAGLAPGPYVLEVRLDGFETEVRRTMLGTGETASIDMALNPSRLSETVVVTSRRVEEVAQQVPIPVSVVSGDLLADSGAFNVDRLKEIVPTVQFYSTNPRNSSLNIRGLGAPFGLTNDGIEPGVGLYIDGTFFARPAASTLDFLDVERVEVLRGPQGTLFGKNTTAGAINVTLRRPSFTPDTRFELNTGSLGLMQAKASVTGRLFDKAAGLFSFSGTTREGTLDDVVTGDDLNGLSNLGFRGQLLFAPNDRTAITFAADNTRQRPRGYAQVVAGVAPTLRSPNRQYPQIAADLGYTPPSFNAFDRLTDADTPHRSHQDLGGASLTIERGIGSGRLTSITAWRYWNWDPSSDRDFIGLPVTTISANPSKQRQWTQEVRYAGDLTESLGLVVGAFAFHQTINSTGRQEQGSAAARFLLAPNPLSLTPGLLDGYGQTSDISSAFCSAALFGQLEWSVTDRLRLLPGLRLNYDQKDVSYVREVYGGLQTTDPALIALQRSILSPQEYAADVDDTNVSGQMTAAFQVMPAVNAYATFATSFKSVGLNMSGVPTDALGRPALDAAVVKPEDERHFELGLKTEPFRSVTANVTFFNTDIRDYQANVVNAQVGVLRGYLANAERVRVRGVEVDAAATVSRNLSVYGLAAYTDGRYLSFTDAPPPLEETGGPQVKDISGSELPGISRWALSFGAEYAHPAVLFGQSGELFAGLDANYRSQFSSSATASRYLFVEGYALVNPRVGFRWAEGWSLFVWSRNALNEEYFQLLSAAPGGSGLYVGLPGDPRTVGVALRVSFGAGN